jgi:hypothetical protein
LQQTHDFHLGPSSTPQNQSDSEGEEVHVPDGVDQENPVLPKPNKPALSTESATNKGAQAMFSSSTKITTLAAGLFLSVATLGGTAQAQAVSDDLVARCSQIVGAMKFEGWPAERNQDTMMRVCHSSGGRMPGAPAEAQLTQSRQLTSRNAALPQSRKVTTRNVALRQPRAVDSGDWMGRASRNYDGGGY